MPQPRVPCRGVPRVRALRAATAAWAVAIVALARPAVAADYRWIGGTSGAWGTPASWSPARSAPAPSDRLTFDSGDSISVTGVTTSTVTALSIVNQTRVHLAAAAAVTLTMGASGTGQLLVGPGSTLALGYGAAPVSTITLQLSTGATALIQGALRTKSATALVLDAADALAIDFAGGSTLELVNHGHPFAFNGIDNVAVFESGSRYISNAGDSPFALPAPHSKIVFQHGSLFWMTQGGNFDIGPRAYGDVRIDGANNVSATGNGGFDVDSLTLSQGELLVQTATSCRIHGSIHLDGGGRLRIFPMADWGDFHLSHDVTGTAPGELEFGGGQAQNILLDGASQQSLSGPIFLSNSSNTLIVDNPNDVRMVGAGSVQGGSVRFVSGRVLTNGNAMSLYGSVVEDAGPATGWFVGALSRQTWPTDSVTFQIGDVNAYVPVNLAFTGLTGVPLVTVSTLPSDHPNVGSSQIFPGQAVHRRWSITGSTQFGSFTSFRARFSWNPADADPALATATSHVLEWDGASWSRPRMWTRTATTAEATGITQFGDFAVGDVPPSEYHFNKADGFWTSKLDWTPARTVPDADDRLVFDRGGAVIALQVPSQTIGQLFVTNHTALSLGASFGAIQMIGGPGADLQVDAGSSLEVDEYQWSLRLGTGCTGSISGAMFFNGGNNSLDATDAGAIAFESGSSFTQTSWGYAFTTSGTEGTVVFKDGSTFRENGGIGTPFGLSAPKSKVIFQPGSTFEVDDLFSLDLAGRTYGRFVYNRKGSFTASLNAPVTFAGIHVTKGALALNTTADVQLTGDLNVDANCGLTINGGPGARFVLDGTQNQNLAFSGTLAITGRLALANAAGATLASDLALPAGLDLSSGPLHTGAYTVRMGPDALVTRTSGWIDGNLQLRVPATGSRVFDVGSVSQYLPVTVQMFGLASAFDLTVGMFNSDHPALASSCLDATRSVNRYWRLTPVGTPPKFTSASLTLRYADTDLDVAAVPADLRAQGFDGASWSTPDASSAANALTLTHLTAFGEFAIADPSHVPLTYAAPPFSPTVVIGQAADLDLTVLGEGPFSYQWRHWGAPVFDGGVYFGAHTNHLHVSFVDRNSVGDYDLVTTGPCSQQVSQVATISATCDGPRGFTQQPLDLTVSIGSPATFHADVQPCHSGVYRWYKDGVLLPLETGDTYTIANVSAADAGVYQLIVSDALGSMASRKATLNLVPPVLLSYTIGTPTPTSAHGAITFAGSVTGSLEQGNTSLLGITQPLTGGQALGFDVAQIGAAQTYFLAHAQSPDGHALVFGSPLNTDYVTPAPGVIVFPSGRPVFSVTATKLGQTWTYAQPTLAITLRVEDLFSSPAWSSSYLVTIEDLRLGAAPAHPYGDANRIMPMPLGIMVPSGIPVMFLTSETGAVSGTKLVLNVRLRWYESYAPGAKSYPLQFSIPFVETTP